MALEYINNFENNNWKQKPTTIDTWSNEVCDYVMFVDENNITQAIDNVRKKSIMGGTISKDERFFTLTGCIFTQENYKIEKLKFKNLKDKYWNKGMWINPKTNEEQHVCFHSIEIRNRKYAFKLDDRYNKFIEELDKTIKDTEYTIISISIDLVEYVLHTSYDLDVYDIAFDFILERFIYELKDKCGIIMLEARGKKEDTKLLKHIVNKCENGTNFISSKKVKNSILGVYFNPKFNKLTNYPVIGLEIADISSYPIHKYVKYGTKDLAFQTLEKKIRNYPNYYGRGLKIYPNTCNQNESITFKSIEESVKL